MKRLQGRMLYIIAVVVALLIVVAWYFLLLNPKRTEISDLTTQVETAQTNLNAEQQKLVRYQSYKKSAPQSRTDVVRLGKMLPESEGVPSLIVDLTKTASAAGVTLDSITNGETSAGAPFGVQTATIQVSGRFFDVEDFLHRLESYVAWRNESLRVTGRILQVTNLNMSSSGDATASTSPKLTVSVTLDAYLWGGGKAAPAATASPSPSPSADGGDGS
jgi:Tfp pilus assembly protein PilO